MFPIKNKKRIFKGSVAVFALIIMFILAVATIGIITTASIERKTSISTGNSTTAFQIAESGMERTLQAIKSSFDGNINGICTSSCSCSGGVLTYSDLNNNTIKFQKITGYNSGVPVFGLITDCVNEKVSEIRIIKSIGTTKLETRAIEEDIFLGATKLLLHLDGKNDDGYLVDSSYYYNKYINNITLKGNADTSTDEEKFSSGSSVKFESNGDYISIPNNSDWNFGTGDFTVDFWAWKGAPAIASFSTYIDIGSASVKIRHDNAGNICAYIMGSSHCGSVALPNNWYHVALVRKTGQIRLFVDGKIKKDDPDGSNIQVTNEIYIGDGHDPSDVFFKGYIDEVRVSKGVARWWNDNFTTPTSAYWPD